MAGVGIFVATFDPNSYKPRDRRGGAAGDRTRLDPEGRIHLGLSLQPTLTVQGVSIANPPGFSRPQMATLQELDLKLALWPLLSHTVEINRLELVKPDILLEINAKGWPNWQFTPAHEPTRHAGRHAARQTGEKTPTQINVSRALSVQNGTVTWRDDAPRSNAVLGRAEPRPSARHRPTRTCIWR